MLIDGVDYDPADPALGVYWYPAGSAGIHRPCGVLLPGGSLVRDRDFLRAVLEACMRRDPGKTLLSLGLRVLLIQDE